MTSPRPTDAENSIGEKQGLALDVEALRRKLGPKKAALIDQWVREVNGPLDAAIAAHVRADSAVLDAGCSRGDPDLPALQGGRLLVGCDVDLPGLRANGLADAAVLAPMGKFPFTTAAFDVIVCKWVAEHLETPDRDFLECCRVLKPGGVLILLTPNAYSFFTLLSRLLPYRLKQVFKGKLFGLHEEDTFRTWYRANTKGQLEALMRGAGLTCASYRLLPGMWTFFIFSTPIAKAVRALERVQLQIPILKHATTYILGVWRKDPA